MGQQFTQINDRLRTGFEQTTTSTEEIRRNRPKSVRRQIEQLTKRTTSGAPATVLLVVATVTGLPLYMLNGAIVAVLGTTVMVLATNQAYPIYMQISQNPTVQFILRLFNRRAAHAEETEVAEHRVAPVPAPVPTPVPAPAPQVQAPNQTQAQQQPEAPATPTPLQSLFSNIFQKQ